MEGGGNGVENKQTGDQSQKLLCQVLFLQKREGVGSQVTDRTKEGRHPQSNRQQIPCTPGFTPGIITLTQTH